MNLGKIIAGIKQNIAIRQKGVHSDSVMVYRRELQFLMMHFDAMDTELRGIHSLRSGQPGQAGAMVHMTHSAHRLASEQNARRLSEQEKLFEAVAGKVAPPQDAGSSTAAAHLVMGAPNAGSIKCPCQNYPLCACASCIPLTPQQNGGFPTEQCEQVKQSQRNQRDIFQLARPPHWATHILKHIPGEILFYSNTGDLTAFIKPRLQPLENQPAYSLSGFEFPGPVQNWEVVKPVTPDLYQMITEQNPERREHPRIAELNQEITELLAEDEQSSSHHKPVTSFDWELQQALIHLQNAISVTDSRRGHLLQAAVSIAKGVKESE